jgi:hypothetical protein
LLPVFVLEDTHGFLIAASTFEREGVTDAQ